MTATIEGGISIRRSLQSALLEDYLDLTNWPSVSLQESYYIRSFYEEAKNRPSLSQIPEEHPRLPFDEADSLSILNTKEVAMLCLAGLKSWHREARRKLERLEQGTEGIRFTEVDFSVEWNGRMIDEICKLLPIPIVKENIDIIVLERMAYRYLDNFKNWQRSTCAEWDWLNPLSLTSLP